ncbi:MAG: protein kinase, partial [Planctomycetes bacterium]|nr:protein kinase [Planctomycetota bacterium]
MTDDPFERLREAHEAFDRFQELGEGIDPSEFLSSHPHLREVLDPVLDPTPDDGRERIVAGDFRIVREIGRGGMGVVYEARQLSLDRRVALKMLAHELSSSPTAVARFRREATLAAGIEHPSVAKVHGFTRDDSGHWLVMELVEGTPLDELLASLRDRRGSLTGTDIGAFVTGSTASSPRAAAAWSESYEHAIVDLVTQIADALDFAHRAGVIHRDVKPSNILVRADGTAILTDFGLARETGAAGVTLTGETAGTPAYQSPEQLDARSQELGPQTDVFSLGATLYEALTFERAFPGETMLDVQDKVRRVEPRNPSRLNPNVDRDLAAILQRALEKDPADRYPSAGALADDLRNWRLARPTAARPVPWFVRARRWCSRNRLAAGFLAVLCTATIVTAVLWWSAQRSLRLFEWLSDGVRVSELIHDYRHAPPAWPENVGALDALLVEARALVARLPEVERNVAAVASRGIAAADGAIAFERVEDRYLYAGTTESLSALANVRDHVIAGLEERRAWALDIEQRSIDEHRDEWGEAVTEIETAHGLRITPQIGLVPLRRDAHSGLWEFWHLRSGSRPEPMERGYRIDEATGIVFVLVLPGTFTMGCQADDATAPNHDESARVRERPPHRVTLERPFFLSKYEMTRGQWARLLHEGEEIAPFDAHPADPREHLDRFPIEDESYDRAIEVLRRFGLTLPTEAQWEDACRAGTTTRWSAGPSITDLDGYANVRDRALEARAAQIMVRVWPPYAPFDDGFPRQAPVDAFA